MNCAAAAQKEMEEGRSGWVGKEREEGMRGGGVRGRVRGRECGGRGRMGLAFRLSLLSFDVVEVFEGKGVRGQGKDGREGGRLREGGRDGKKKVGGGGGWNR